MTTPQGIADEVAPQLQALGLRVEDVTVTPAGRRRVVRVAVDRVLPDAAGPTTTPTPSLTLDEVADATRAVSDALDAGDVMGEQPYTLEVTSPGVDRPLHEPRHYRRNVGRLVQLTLREGAAVTGRITSADDEQVEVAVPGAKGRPPTRRTLAYAEITRAVVQVEFNRPGAQDDLPDGLDDEATDDGPADDDSHEPDHELLDTDDQQQHEEN